MNPAAPPPAPVKPRSRPGRARIAAPLLVARLLLLLVLGCGSEQHQEAPAAASPTAGARKIASLAPVATNLLLELEGGDRIIAVDAESAKRPGLAHRPRVPETEDEAFLLLTSLETDLVVLPASRITLSQRLAAANIRTIVVLIRSFEDGFTLFGELAGRVGLSAAARERIAAASRPLAAIAAESTGSIRPRVAVIESFEPLVLVGDDQLATALVEIAGGENVTDGRGSAAIPIERATLAELAPAVLFHVRPSLPSPSEREALAASVADIAPLVVAEFEPDRFYAPQAAIAARTLRDALAPLARPLDPSEESDEASPAPEAIENRRAAKEF